ncbi:MAG: translation initiation factor [Synergistaceae bacterium]|jgi:translation initiation factor 1 (eIF-1/SUI1)|nr:translation initiation factor [Synergistaceae bacterium]
MMSKGRAKRIDANGGITLGSMEVFALPIGRVMGDGSASPEEETANGSQAESDERRRDLPDSVDFFKAAQATLHRESSGRGGRTVTVISFKPAPDKELAEVVAKAMRRGLGCGSHVEEFRIVLQGDMRDRAGQWLVRQGVISIRGR